MRSAALSCYASVAPTYLSRNYSMKTIADKYVMHCSTVNRAVKEHGSNKIR
jgi:hypothetical protein